MQGSTAVVFIEKYILFCAAFIIFVSIFDVN